MNELYFVKILEEDLILLESILDQNGVTEYDTFPKPYMVDGELWCVPTFMCQEETFDKIRNEFEDLTGRHAYVTPRRNKKD